MTDRVFTPDDGTLIWLDSYNQAGSHLQDWNYYYDALGNLTQRVGAHDPVNVQREDFRYDKMNRLLKVDYIVRKTGSE